MKGGQEGVNFSLIWFLTGFIIRDFPREFLCQKIRMSQDFIVRL